MKKIFIALALAALLAGCTQMQQPSQDTNQSTALQTFTASIEVYDSAGSLLYSTQIPVRSNQSLFEAMQAAQLPIEYKQYSFGAMITSIDGKEPENGQYIAIYVNDEYANAGVSDLKLTQDTNILFKFTDILAPA